MPTIITRYKNKKLHAYTVEKGSPLSIGRIPDNDIVIDNDAVSGRHARIVTDGDEYFIEDLNSTNGTFLNNKRIRSRKLKDDDVVVIGKHDLVFKAAADDHGEAIDSPELDRGMTSRDKTSKLDSSEYKKLMAQNVYDANKATLLILKFKDQQIRKYVLDKQKEMMIGRLADNTIVIDNDAVSGRHAKIFSVEDEYYIQDLESTNGTLVNTKPIETHVLKDEDVITIGKHELIYCQYETYTLEETLLSYDAGVDYSTDGTRAVNVSKLGRELQQAGTPPDGSPTPDRGNAFLSFAKGGRGNVPIEAKGIKIGKDPGADIPLKGFLVGRITVMISKTGTGYYLSCQEKKKGAKVNGKAVKGPVKLKDADTIEVGSVKLVFHNN